MKLKWALLLWLCSFSSVALGSGNEKIRNFTQAKKLAAKIHAEHPFTIYCNCRYEGKTIDLESCGYRPHKDNRRARSLEWEHVVPAESFGQAFVEWREGAAFCMRKGRHFKGRKCAEKNAEFARMEADLYNLWPEVGELNGLRNNFSMAALGGAETHAPRASFGACKAVVSGKKFEPMDLAKGIVARTYQYMDGAYPGRGIISDKNRKLFEAWDKMFPVTDWECQRAEKIRAVQKNENPILQERCTKAGKMKK